ncbi:ribonuclease HII [Kiloniella sp. b19]|uniref:ribonuclease HII n=1 Tax=Kiloniella sp. GXU_MW_B19 TaxID=3141326 RepID=UPI0031DDD208
MTVRKTRQQTQESPDYTEEQSVLQSLDVPALVIGLDEAGRGPWAGPVVAGAAWLNPQDCPQDLLTQLNDSKKLSAKRRESLFERMEELSSEEKSPLLWSTGSASVEEIDEINILQASFLSMRRAKDALLEQLGLRFPNHKVLALVDGNKDPNLSLPVRTLVKGDGRSLSIAAASICAKVLRDREMSHLAELYPGYAFEKNQGYGTKDHQNGLAKLGVCPAHRLTFRPVKERLEVSN